MPVRALPPTTELDLCRDELAQQVVMGGRDARAPVAMPAKGIPQQGEAPALILRRSDGRESARWLPSSGGEGAAARPCSRPAARAQSPFHSRRGEPPSGSHPALQPRLLLFYRTTFVLKVYFWLPKLLIQCIHLPREHKPQYTSPPPPHIDHLTLSTTLPPTTHHRHTTTPTLDEKEDRGRAKNKLDEFHVM